MNKRRKRAQARAHLRSANILLTNSPNSWHSDVALLLRFAWVHVLGGALQLGKERSAKPEHQCAAWKIIDKNVCPRHKRTECCVCQKCRVIQSVSDRLYTSYYTRKVCAFIFENDLHFFYHSIAYQIYFIMWFWIELRTSDATMLIRRDKVNNSIRIKPLITTHLRDTQEVSNRISHLTTAHNNLIKQSARRN